MGIEVREQSLTRYDLWTADECFLTGTAAEVIAAVSLDGREIGDGRPGPMTMRLLDAFHALVGSSGTPVD
jgi:branched-chain amino acid aminotransferase